MESFVLAKKLILYFLTRGINPLPPFADPGEIFGRLVMLFLKLMLCLD